MAATASLSTPGLLEQSPPSGLAAGPEGKRTKRIRVPPKISIGDLTPNNIGTLRKLNAVLFPVRYSDKFYKEVLSPELENYCKLVYYNDIPVGAICCRIELDESVKKESKDSESKRPTGRLYLMTLGVLAPYRRQGLATKLLNYVYNKATEASLAALHAPATTAAPAPANTSSKAAKDKKDKGKGKAVESAAALPPTPPMPILRCVFVHVQTSMEDSKAFWLKQDFEEKELIREYYKKDIEGPRDAWMLERAIDLSS